MVLNQTFELSLILDTDPFQRIFTTKASYLKEVELDGEYIDWQRRASLLSTWPANTKRGFGFLPTLA